MGVLTIQAMCGSLEAFREMHRLANQGMKLANTEEKLQNTGHQRLLNFHSAVRIG